MVNRPRVELLAAGVASGLTVKVAAKRAGMAVTTARHWLARPEARRRVAELTAELTARTVALAAFASLPPDQRAEVARLLRHPG